MSETVLKLLAIWIPALMIFSAIFYVLWFLDKEVKKDEERKALKKERKRLKKLGLATPSSAQKP